MMIAMKKLKINRIDPMSAAKISGLIGIVIGMITGAMFALMAMAGMPFNVNGESARLFPFGIGIMVAMILFYGVFAFLQGLIGAWFYNIVAGWVGPIEIE